MLELVVHFSIFEESFCRNAPPVQTYSTELVAFHDGGFQTELGGTDGSDVPSRAAADNHNIKLSFRHRNERYKIKKGLPSTLCMNDMTNFKELHAKIYEIPEEKSKSVATRNVAGGQEHRERFCAETGNEGA